jgi:hypothetical protein
LFAGAVFSSEIQQFRISAVSEVSFSEFSESVQLDEKKSLFDISPTSREWMKGRLRVGYSTLKSGTTKAVVGHPRNTKEVFKKGQIIDLHPFDGARYVGAKSPKDKGSYFFVAKYHVDPIDPINESVQIDEMSARDHYRRYKNKNRVTSIDRERFPNREREGLEGPYRTKKTGLIYYYDTKAKKYYDPQTDMYLSVDDIMEGMGINESDHYSKKDLFTDRDIKKLSKAYGNENYEDGYRGDKQDLPGAVKDMLRYINNYSNNDLIVIALADIPYASTQAMIQLESIRGYKIKSRPPKRRSDFVKK